MQDPRFYILNVQCKKYDVQCMKRSAKSVKSARTIIIDYCIKRTAYCLKLIASSPIFKLTHFQFVKFFQLPSPRFHPNLHHLLIPIPSRIDKILNIIARTQHKAVSCVLLNV